MKKSSLIFSLALVLSILILPVSLTSCKKSSAVKYPKGTFPDSTIALTDINSQYDDINMNLFEINGNKELIFASKRNGGQFDLIQGMIDYKWDQTNGIFDLQSAITSDAFLTKLLTAANTSKNDYGPYRLYSATDGYEYLILASENSSGNLDFYYLKNIPAMGSNLPDVLGPYPVTLLNTSSDDAYMSFNTKQDSLYFSSAIGGKFDIYQKKISTDTSLTNYFDRSYKVSTKVDSVNSTADDKFPFVYKNLMVFASNRTDGFGGYDLYYSVFKKGKWSSPVNFGSSVNTIDNEWRPIIGANNSFINNFMIFSSDRSGGKGGYDLYFKGIKLPN